MYKITLPQTAVQAPRNQLIKSVRFLPVLFDEGEIVIKLDESGAKALLHGLTYTQQVALKAQLYAVTDEILRNAINGIGESPDQENDYEHKQVKAADTPINSVA
ncbi:MAG: hypothetical protein JWM07_47 [Candidatus Saccharibacteria bacterium]|nr:hypothetical protein [Candidatus Saccharibacteria bacterium]